MSSSPTPLDGPADLRHQAGTAGFRRVAVAFFCAGVATFALLWAPQPLMPLLSRSFHVSPALSSLSLAVTTATLGLTLLFAGWVSDAVGRTRVMTWSLVLATLLAIACAFAPSFAALLVLRALEGIALAGLPGVAMAYLAEEVHGASLGLSIGLYIGGNAIGGMSGRLIAGELAGIGGWQLGLAGIGGLGLLCALAFLKLLPRSVHFTPRAFELQATLRRVRSDLTEPGLLRLDAVGALLMGAFVAVYNGLGFRLSAPPYHLGQGALAAVFLVYPIGSFSSAWAGRLADKLGRRPVLPLAIVLAGVGLVLTSAHALPLIVLGIATLTAGFFAGHSVASSWVGRRGSGRTGSAAQASALYLLAYYGGSSFAGIVAGAAWSDGQWTAVTAVAGTLLTVALLLALRLRRTPPLARTAPAVVAVEAAA